MVMGWGKRDTVRKREERDMTGFFFSEGGKVLNEVTAVILP